MIVCDKCRKPVKAGKTLTSTVNMVRRFRYCKDCGITYVTCEIIDYRMNTSNGEVLTFNEVMGGCNE